MGLRIVVAEDDLSLIEFLDTLLVSKNMQPVFAKTAQDAFRAVKELTPDCVLADWSLLNGTGLELTARIRRDPQSKTLPILIISGKQTTHENIAAAIEAGADDFLAKPFDPLILLSKIHALVRRASWQATIKPKPRIINFKNLTLDLTARTAHLDEKPVILTYTEYELLLLFINRKGEALDRQTLLNAISTHPDKVYHQVIDKHIENLRKKIGELAVDLETVRNVGYRLA